MVDRMRTTSALCVAEMCWVMCTMESMATSGLAWTRLRVKRQKKNTITISPQFVRWLERWETMARPTAVCTECWERLPADLLEDVISADVLDVLVDDGPGALLFGQLPLQPRHHLFVVVPQIGLRNRRRGG